MSFFLGLLLFGCINIITAGLVKEYEKVLTKYFFVLILFKYDFYMYVHYNIQISFYVQIYFNWRIWFWYEFLHKNGLFG